MSEQGATSSEKGQRSEQETIPTAEKIFRGEWDEEGVFFYQAYNDEIADWSLEHQKVGGPCFKPTRMTWIKPSFAWVLYRSGYGSKDKNQKRILKIKLSHESVATILSRSKLSSVANKYSEGCIQWDPERDIMSVEADEKKLNPRKMPLVRAIQIGMRAELSAFYVENILSVEDVTVLAQRVGMVHKLLKCNDTKGAEAVEELIPDLPVERPYLPECSEEVLRDLEITLPS